MSGERFDDYYQTLSTLLRSSLDEVKESLSDEDYTGSTSITVHMVTHGSSFGTCFMHILCRYRPISSNAGEEWVSMLCKLR